MLRQLSLSLALAAATATAFAASAAAGATQRSRQQYDAGERMATKIQMLDDRLARGESYGHAGDHATSKYAGKDFDYTIGGEVFEGYISMPAGGSLRDNGATPAAVPSREAPRGSGAWAHSWWAARQGACCWRRTRSGCRASARGSRASHAIMTKGVLGTSLPATTEQSPSGPS